MEGACLTRDTWVPTWVRQTRSAKQADGPCIVFGVVKIPCETGQTNGSRAKRGELWISGGMGSAVGGPLVHPVGLCGLELATGTQKDAGKMV